MCIYFLQINCFIRLAVYNRQINMFDQRIIAICFLLCFAIVFNFSLHRIEEGHVGVYFRVRYFQVKDVSI